MSTNDQEHPGQGTKTHWTERRHVTRDVKDSRIKAQGDGRGREMKSQLWNRKLSLRMQEETPTETQDYQQPSHQTPGKHTIQDKQWSQCKQPWQDS